MFKMQPQFIATLILAFMLATAKLLTSAATAIEPAPDPLFTLAGDVWAQFELAYRSQPAEYERHRVQFNAVIEAWRAAPDPKAADKLLVEWMHAAIQASMPGSRTLLPPMPQFNPNIQRQSPLAGMDLLKTQYAPPTTARPKIRPVTATVVDPFQDDPFFDDPVSK